MRLFPIVFVTSSAVLAGLVGGCADASDATGSVDQNDTIHPTGNDHPGQIVVTMPAGLVPNDGIGFEIDGTTDSNTRGGSDAAIGRPVGPLPTGSHRVMIYKRIGNWTEGAQITADVRTDASTTIALAGIRYVTPTGNVLGLGSDRHVDESDGNVLRDRAFAIFGTHDDRGFAAWPFWNDDPATISARPAGAYHVRFGLFDGFDVTLASDQIAILDPLASPSRRTIALTAPSREFPSVCSQWLVQGTRPDTRTATPDRRSSSPFDLAQGESLTIGEFVAADVQPVQHELHLFATSSGYRQGERIVSLTLGAGATLKIGRIDVADVSVRQNDGTTIVVRGTYDIAASVIRGGVESFVSYGCSAPTSTGQDVAPGKYRVSVRYTTVEAGSKVDVHDITIQ